MFLISPQLQLEDRGRIGHPDSKKPLLSNLINDNLTQLLFWQISPLPLADLSLPGSYCPGPVINRQHFSWASQLGFQSIELPMLPSLKQTEMAENLFLYCHCKNLFLVKLLHSRAGILFSFAVKQKLLTIHQFLKLIIKLIFLSSLKIILTNVVCAQKKQVNNFNGQKEILKKHCV